MAALLRHIEGRVASIEQRKDDLVDEIQLAVDMVCVCKVNDIISRLHEIHALPWLILISVTTADRGLKHLKVSKFLWT